MKSLYYLHLKDKRMHCKDYTTGTFSHMELQHAREELGPFILTQVLAVLSSLWWHTIFPEPGQTSHWAGGRPTCRYNLMSQCSCLWGHFNHYIIEKGFICAVRAPLLHSQHHLQVSYQLEQWGVWQGHCYSMWTPWSVHTPNWDCLSLSFLLVQLPVVLTIPIRWHSNCFRGLEGGLGCSHQSCISTNKHNQAQHPGTLHFYSSIQFHHLHLPHKSHSSTAQNSPGMSACKRQIF